ncbi:MAG: 4Fe-4S dicluster domain-containing protein [Peptococcaceae bacterium]|nr:4Fe-4S dicluster domain-containing protein [Peptococcaceae bacterium]
MSGLTRRQFLKRTLASGVAAGLVLSGGVKPSRASSSSQVGTFYDLTKCDGCRGQKAPLCVTACREENRSKFPNPVPSDQIPYYWPNKKKEDWQGKKELTNRLTPYNWTFVQKVAVEHNGKKEIIFIPRRCMHCNNPPCANLCPFGAQYKSPEGPVLINKDLCLGGAKCRDVCPWGIPARQAGVGLYMKIAPRFLGAGVMYKCDLCYDRIKKGRKPACVEACPGKAVVFGEINAMREMARKRAAEIGGYIYGDKENGGTSTFYVSPAPFDKINKDLQDQKSRQPDPSAPGFPLMPAEVGNFLDTANGIAAGILVAPVAGAAAAGYAAYKTMKEG